MSRLLSERVDAMLGGLGWAGTQAAWRAVRDEIPESPQKACVAETWDSDLSEVINTHRPPPVHRSDIACLATLRTWLQGYEAGVAGVRAPAQPRNPLDARVLAARVYPTEPGLSSVRAVAHALNVGDSIESAASAMARLITPIEPGLRRDALILIPLPGADGTTAQNRALAQAIAVRAQAYVCDVLVGPARQSHYLRKKAGRPMTPDEIGTVTMRPVDVLRGSVVYFVDNVYDTGATAEAARRALVRAGIDVPCYVLVWAATNRHLRA